MSRCDDARSLPFAAPFIARVARAGRLTGSPWSSSAPSALLAVLAVLALVLVPRSAAAQGNYRLAPVGGRTTLVGGTGLVYGADSAAAFLNPATVVRVDSGRLAFSVNFYSFSVATAPKWYQPGDIDRTRFGNVQTEGASVDNYDVDSLPGSLCLYFRVADIPFLEGKASKDLRQSQARLGMCLASVQNSTYSFNAEDYAQSGPFGVSRQAATVRQTFRRISIGPTYSMYVTNALAIGASLHLSRTSHRAIIGNTSTLYGNDRVPITSILLNTSRGDAHEMSLTVGATYRIGAHQTVALAIEAPSLFLFGSGGMNNYTHFDGANGTGTENFAAQGLFRTQQPFRIAIGTGIERSWGTAELNVSAHAPVGEAYRAELDGRAYVSDGARTIDSKVSPVLSARARGAVNVGVGGEYYMSPRLSVLGGLGTDLSVVPNGALGRDPFNYFPADTHRLSASLGIGSHGEGGDLLVGAEFSTAWGQRLAVNAYQAPARVETTDTRTHSILFILAGSTSFKALKRAVSDVTTALDPTKPAVPAGPAGAPPTPAIGPPATKPDPTKP